VKDLIGKLTLVTGAGSGIGRATALLFAERGARVVAVDVDGGRVDATRIALGDKCVLARRVDVSQRTEMAALAEEVHGDLGVVDVLVNNAGVGHGGGVVDTPLTDWDWVLGVNLGGVVHGCHFFVPRMVARGAGGHVVNVASVFGLVAAAGVAPYCASKFAVVGLSESLRAELHPHGIGVSTICPGLIATDIIEKSRFLDESLRPRMAAYFAQRGRPPAMVARAIARAIEKNTAVVPVGVDAWFSYLGKRAVPQVWGWLGREFEKRAKRV
jgi:NAD(P)-dependent dehydrogenase (short-subunit alcohol dehydrogenase family)